MRIGIVSPYSFDVPGGVQNHITDLAEALIGLGHEVSVLAPADEDAALPPYVVPAGRAVPLPYNGSVARIAFGPVSTARVRITTQRLAEAFERGIAEYPQDWHMLQRLWLDENARV